ncbi:unnamed protein product [Phytomonas sp. EM1]|nr:unnamed protein product [Phytomonas sp. EM1]|eukprot:CCW60702.1 unnamed protein product [Phytomonas sp. isolate EM1]
MDGRGTMKLKRGNKINEVLPDPSKLPDGKFNYYIRGWSSYTSIKNLTKISHELVASCTAENREVGPIPKTNVLILPADRNTHDGEEDSEGSLTVEVELADQLQVEGITKKLMKEKAALIRTWKPVDPAQALPPPPSQPPAEEGKSGNDADSEKDPEPSAGTAQAFKDEDATNAIDVPPSSSLISVPLPSPPAVDPEYLLEELQKLELDYGSQFGNLDNCIVGDLHIMGVEPNIVVHPDIVPEVAEEEKKTASKRRISQTKQKGKGGKKAKLTPEQLAELERQKEEEKALRERQVQESIERARRKEEFLKTFSHPDRWAQITISGLTFMGSIRVSRAHVTFLNCRFMSPLDKGDNDEPQLSVFPYSVVRLTKCTFETPTSCGLYAFPCSQVLVKKCLFSGLPHQELALNEYKDRIGDTRDPPNIDNAEVSSSKSNDEFINKFSSKANGDPESSEQPLSEELTDRYNALRERNESLVGVQVDSARVSIKSCRFICLGTGVLFCGRCVLSELPPLSFVVNEFKSPTAMTMTNSQLHHMYGTAVVIEAFDVLLKDNEIHDCEYYGLDCYAKCVNVSVLRNRFGIRGTVRIRKGIRIKLLNNTLHETLMDDNVYDNPCLEPVY